jgi:hypothetical protein
MLIDRRIAAIASLVLLAACSISPPDSGLKCPDGRCPSGQSCVRGVERERSPDAGWPSSKDAGARDAGKDVDAALRPSKMCGDGCSGDTPVCVDGMCVECATGTRLCDGDTPVVCAADHRKQRQAACSGDAPICNNGVCRDIRLRGGLVTTEPVLRSTSGMRLVDQSLTRTAAKCLDLDGQRVCLHGGLEP